MPARGRCSPGQSQTGTSAPSSRATFMGLGASLVRKRRAVKRSRSAPTLFKSQSNSRASLGLSTRTPMRFQVGVSMISTLMLQAVCSGFAAKMNRLHPKDRDVFREMDHGKTPSALEFSGSTRGEPRGLPPASAPGLCVSGIGPSLDQAVKTARAQSRPRNYTPTRGEHA